MEVYYFYFLMKLQFFPRGGAVSRFYGARLAAKSAAVASVSKKGKRSAAGTAFATATVDTSVKL